MAKYLNAMTHKRGFNCLQRSINAGSWMISATFPVSGGANAKPPPLRVPPVAPVQPAIGDPKRYWNFLRSLTSRLNDGLLQEMEV